MFNKTMYYQKQYGFKYNENDKKHAAWNNEADVYKHAYMQSIGSLRYSGPLAEVMGFYHEKDGNIRYGQPKGEETLTSGTTGFASNIQNEIPRKNIYFSNEDVGKMATREFLEVEDIINRQLKEGSMQNKDYFNSKVKNGDMIWVDEYIRSDGTKVSGYYMAK